MKEPPDLVSGVNGTPWLLQRWKKPMVPFTPDARSALYTQIFLDLSFFCFCQAITRLITLISL